MDQMEVTKLFGAICGSLLVFLLISTAAHGLYSTHSDQVVFEVPLESTGGDAAAPAAEVDVDALVAAADVAKGETVFKKCAACHKVDGSNAVGPHLNGVFNRDKGSVPDFKYSAELTGIEGSWTAADLFHFLESPKKYAPGTAMAFAGLPKPEDRANVIAYLETLP